MLSRCSLITSTIGALESAALQRRLFRFLSRILATVDPSSGFNAYVPGLNADATEIREARVPFRNQDLQALAKAQHEDVMSSMGGTMLNSAERVVMFLLECVSVSVAYPLPLLTRVMVETGPAIGDSARTHCPIFATSCRASLMYETSCAWV